MSEAAQIRLAGVEDVDAVVTLQVTTPTAPQWSAASYETILRSDRHLLLVAMSPEGVVGYVSATRVVDEVEVGSIVVETQKRRQGIGEALMRAVQVWGAQHGATRLFLEVRESNASARQLYGKLGFEEVGRRHAYYSRPTETAIVLRRMLG